MGEEIILKKVIASWIALHNTIRPEYQYLIDSTKFVNRRGDLVPLFIRGTKNPEIFDDPEYSDLVERKLTRLAEGLFEDLRVIDKYRFLAEQYMKWLVSTDNRRRNLPIFIPNNDLLKFNTSLLTASSYSVFPDTLNDVLGGYDKVVPLFIKDDTRYSYSSETNGLEFENELYDLALLGISPSRELCIYLENSNSVDVIYSNPAISIIDKSYQRPHKLYVTGIDDIIKLASQMRKRY